MTVHSLNCTFKAAYSTTVRVMAIIITASVKQQSPYPNRFISGQMSSQG